MLKLPSAPVSPFAVLTASWCAAGALLVSHRRATDRLRHWGDWIVPPVFVAIGLYIFVKAGILT